MIPKSARLAAIREDELAAAAMGINVVNYKLIAFAVGAACAGTMGVLLLPAALSSVLNLSTLCSHRVLSMVFWRSGQHSGVILGAAVVVVLNLQILQGFHYG